MFPDKESCWRALVAHDVRFDGVFFVGVTSTRIYCRPVCRARTPRRENCRFFASAAAAERARFRPCLRCRPELAPGHSSVDATTRLAREAVQRITAGALNEAGVEDLARTLGVGERQLRRVVEREIGVTPVELAQTCRLLLAKRLLTDTALPVTQVAYTSGFGSLRRFNALFVERYRMSPSALRKESRRADSAEWSAAAWRALHRAPVTEGSSPGETIYLGKTARLEPHAGTDRAVETESVALTLAYRPPLAWGAMLGFLAARAIPGVERVDGERYVRTIRLDGHMGIVSVEQIARPVSGSRHVRATSGSRSEPLRARAASRPDSPGAMPGSLRVSLSVTLLPVLMPLLARLRGFFDLDASPAEIEGQLARGGLAELVRRAPGLRVPGAVDGFELAWRAVVGQQVTVRGATTLAGRLVAALGEPMATGEAGLRCLSPTPERVANASVATLAGIGVPRARAESLRALARAVADGTLRFDASSDGADGGRRLTEIGGIGEWTAEYIAMRALRWPDAFPASDLALRRASGGLTPARLRLAAERWRPWRAYAAMHLWHGLAQGRVAGVATGSDGSRAARTHTTAATFTSTARRAAASR